MKIKKFVLISAFLSIFLSLFGFIKNDGAYIAEAEDTTYTYTREVETSTNFDRTTTTERYYMDDIEGLFGDLTKTFTLPSSFSVSASLKQDVIRDVIAQIITESGISPGSYYSDLAIEVDGITRQYGSTSIEASLYPDANLDDYIGSRVIESEGEYDIEGYYIFHLYQMVSIRSFRSIYIYFNLNPLHMTPISDGSLVYLYSILTVEDGGNSGVDLTVHAVDGVFSSDPNSSGYIVSQLGTRDGTTDLPGNTDEYEVTFHYDNKASITGSDYFSNDNPIRDEPYTISATLRFKTVDGVWHTLNTNTVVIKEHTLTMRINGTDDYRVAVNKEYQYSFIFDDGDYEDARLNDYYSIRFGEEYCTNVDVNGNNMDVNGNIKYTFTEVGTKNIFINNIYIYYNNDYEFVAYWRLNFEVEVLSEEPEIIPPDYHIDFSFPNNSAAIFGGSQFVVSASINEFYGDEHFVTEIDISGNSLGVLETSDDSLTLIPLSVGRSVIRFRATSLVAGEFSEMIFLDVVESREDNTSIEFVDDFNLTGSDVIAYLKIGEFSSFVNMTPKWSIQVENGETLEDVPFQIDELGRAIIKEAPKGYYHISVEGEGIETVERVRRVADVNMAELAASLLPYVAPTMVLIVILVIILRHRYTKRHTLYLKLTKIAKVLNAFIEEDNERAYRRHMRKLIRKIKNCESSAYLRDQETLGQYQSICNILSRSLKMCHVMSVKMKKKDIKKFLRVLKAQYIDEAIRICKELDEALDKYASQKVVAVVTAPKAPKSDKKHDYEEMLKKFYRHGDDEDDNNRAGDSDRNTDTKTEG